MDTDFWPVILYCGRIYHVDEIHFTLWTQICSQLPLFKIQATLLEPDTADSTEPIETSSGCPYKTGSKGSEIVIHSNFVRSKYPWQMPFQTPIFLIRDHLTHKSRKKMGIVVVLPGSRKAAANRSIPSIPIVRFS